MKDKLKDALFLQIGGKYLPMERISYKIFRSINPRKEGKYLAYFCPGKGEGYYRIKRENSLPALRKQMRVFLDQKMTFSDNDFLKQIKFIGAYFYNNLLLFEERDVLIDLKTWRLALRNFLTGKEIPLLPAFNLEHEITNFRGKRQNVLIENGKNFLYFWLGKVLEGEVKIKLCQADGCERVFIESRSDQKFCSEQCRKRMVARRNKLKKLLSK